MIAELRYRFADGTALHTEVIDIKDDNGLKFNENNTFSFTIPKPRDRSISVYGRDFKDSSIYTLVENGKESLQLYEDGVDITSEFDYIGLYIEYLSNWWRYEK